MRILLTVSLAAVALAACATSAERPAATDAASARPIIEAIGRSVEGRPITCRTIGPADAPTLLVIATIHGNEAAGTPLVEQFEGWLLRHPETLRGRRIAIVPVANPDGMERNALFNVHGVDLNRNFPAENFRGSRRHGRAPLSEPEARALHDLILRLRPDRVVSIHQPVNLIDWDGDGADLARAMATAAGMPARRIGSRPGSLGSWVGLTRDVPIITVELPRTADDLDAATLWARYGGLLRVAASFPRPPGGSPGAP